MKLRSVALGSVGGILGLGLIGVGAHATFTANATAHQVVSDGTTSIILHSHDAAASGNTTPNLTLDPITTGGSTFYQREQLSIINNGQNDINKFTLTSSATATNTLAKNVHACVTLRGSTTVVYTGPANNANETLNMPLADGTRIRFTVRLFAGAHSNRCHATTVPSLPPGAEGQTTQFTLHVVGTG